jgi:hypothetical protein
MGSERCKKLITDLSKDREKIYIDICKTNNLEINLGCSSYYDELRKGDFHGMYRYRALNVLYLCLIRYIKLVRPSSYRDNRETIMSYYTKQRFTSGYGFVLSLLPFHMMQFWEYCLRKVKY